MLSVHHPPELALCGALAIRPVVVRARLVFGYVAGAARCCCCWRGAVPVYLERRVGVQFWLYIVMVCAGNRHWLHVSALAVELLGV